MTYQADALRTEHTPDFINPAFFGGDAAHARKIGRLLHAFLGLATELGEAADQLKKHLIYGKPLDEVIAKLKVRFPDKFTQARAVDRDLDAERAVLEPPRDGGETPVAVAAVAAVVVDEPTEATTEVTP